MQILRDALLDPLTGKPRRGALSRMAEAMQLGSRTTLRKWLSGEWVPGAETTARIESLLRAGVDLSARKTGPKVTRKKKSRVVKR